jgi:predicted metal-dependent hydrolase
MRSVRYGTRLIQYNIQEKHGLKSHYISVDKHAGVVLKGDHLPAAKADQLILKKAKWILKKLEVVKTVADDTIAIGSRLPYFGKNYYVEVIADPANERVLVEFNYSKFKIHINTTTTEPQIRQAIQAFYKIKAAEKITPRVAKIAAKTKLKYTHLSFRKMSQRWGSCTGDNRIIINIDAAKLPYTLIDYLVVHELCHTKVKDHSKAFWAELSKHEPKWKELDGKMQEMRM